MFQVLHARKIPTDVGLINVLQHVSREKIDRNNPPDYLNPDKLSCNHNGVSYSYALRKRNELLKGLSRKPQKNAAKAIEIVVSATDCLIDWEEYFSRADFFLRQRFGHENVLSYSIHYDEKTPHMHILFVPIVKNAKGKRTYSSSTFLGGRKGLAQLQTDFNREVGSKFMLQRGEVGSRASHQSLIQYNRKMKERENQLGKKEKELNMRENQLSERENQLSERLFALKQEETQLIEKKAKMDDFRIKAMGDAAEILKMYNQKIHPKDIPAYENKVFRALQGTLYDLKKATEEVEVWRNYSPEELESLAKDYRKYGVTNRKAYENAKTVYPKPNNGRGR